MQKNKEKFQFYRIKLKFFRVKLEEDYDWELILKIAVPVSLIEAYLFYIGIQNGWKWFSLVVGLLLSGGIVYLKDKKKNNVFTAAGIVFLAAMAVKLLKESGIF